MSPSSSAQDAASTEVKAGKTDKTLAVLQPGYLPWLGFFDQMNRADVFVIYDDVQFDKNGWRNRNRIKTPAGPHWLTVPVNVEFGQRILDVKIDNRKPWAKKHLGTIKQFYKQAPHLNFYFPAIEEILSQDWDSLIDLDMALISKFHNWLDLTTEVVRASELNVEGDRNVRLLNFCKYFGASKYLSGNAAQDYLDLSLFQSEGISVEWQDYVHPIYPQLYGQFEPYLSILDLLLNCGPDSLDIIAGPSNK